MEVLYAISFLLSLFGLVAWFFVQGNRKLSIPASATFLLGFITYLLALTFADAEFDYKLMILFRDLLVLGVISQLFNIFQKSKVLSLFLAFAAVLTLYFSYFDTLVSTFPQVNVSNLDSSAEFLVKTKLAEEDIAKLESEFNCVFTVAFTPLNSDQTELDDYYAVNDLTSMKKRSRKRLMVNLERTEGIDWIEPNEVLVLELPNKEIAPESLSQKNNFYLNDPAIQQQWGFVPMHVDALHQFLDQSGVTPLHIAKIAIVDSGVDAEHEDLKGNYVSFNKKYDTDPHRHGTHCAGIAGAVSNNGIGIASLSPAKGFVEVTSYKVMNAMGMGTQKKVINGIIEAVDSGADVISLSLGGPSQRKKEVAYQEAIDYARDNGAIVVVAAGNSNQNATTMSPANAKGVIVVSAVNKNNEKAFFSNTLEDVSMGIAAPGQDIYSTIPGSKYETLSGTSMAAPYVSGLIGILKSIQPNLTTEEVYDILTRTGAETKDGKRTGLLIQPFKAVMEVVD